MHLVFERELPVSIIPVAGQTQRDSRTEKIARQEKGQNKEGQDDPGSSDGVGDAFRNEGPQKKTAKSDYQYERVNQAATACKFNKFGTAVPTVAFLFPAA